MLNNFTILKFVKFENYKFLVNLKYPNFIKRFWIIILVIIIIVKEQNKIIVWNNKVINFAEFIKYIYVYMYCT